MHDAYGLIHKLITYMEMQGTCDDVNDNELSSEIMEVRLNDSLSSIGGDFLFESGDDFLQHEEWGEEVSS